MLAALLGEGSSDRALLPILRWMLGCASPAGVRVEWIDISRLGVKSRKLVDRVAAARLASHCELLFVHRDSDNQPPEWRYQEIRDAAQGLVFVAVVPIRMTEAWLLVDERAIRAASGRITGTHDLGLPPINRLESEANPKETLHRALLLAHQSTGRRARRFDSIQAMFRMADLVEDWSALRRLSAFQRLEADTREALQRLGLPVNPRLG